MQHTEDKYERLYSKLLRYAEQLHQANKRRIRRGLIWLFLLPMLLGLILLVTGADRIVFLIVWVLCMFVICSYLITVEYVDDAILKAINEVSEEETQFDTLLPHHESLHRRLAERLAAEETQGEEEGTDA